ncbi:hypothetical protein ACLOJK_019137 [Asimina triloba]
MDGDLGGWIEGIQGWRPKEEGHSWSGECKAAVKSKEEAVSAPYTWDGSRRALGWNAGSIRPLHMGWVKESTRMKCREHPSLARGQMKHQWGRSL